MVMGVDTHKTQKLVEVPVGVEGVVLGVECRYLETVLMASSTRVS